MKRILKIVGIIVLILVVFLIAAPFLFKGTIEKQVKKAINKNVNASVEWSDLGLSLFSSFPDARLKLEDISVINKAPFEGDTLVSAKTLFLDMGIPQLFKSGDSPLSINELGLEEAFVNIEVNEEGVANYDIAIESDKTEEKEDSDDALTLNISHYEIKNSRINYLDESSKMFLRLKEFNHEGKGDFSTAVSTLSTKTDGLLSFKMGESEYFENTALHLDADIKMDLDNMKFSFEDNKALINQLELIFEGYVQVNEDNQEMDISFNTPTSDFKNFLGVIPKEYISGLDQVETSGDFDVDGRIYGVMDEEHIAKMDIAVSSENAYFKFPDLPKAVQHINFNAILKNETGLMKDMNLALPKLTFTIDQDVFSANGNFKDLMGNILIDIAAKGRLNLANIDQAYPFEMDMDLNGILNADMTTSFAMDDLEKERYERIASSGSASLRDFRYTSEEMANPVEISKAALQFNPKTVNLEEFSMKTGQTDAHLSGTIQNLMGYLFKDQPIKGNFNLNSQTFAVSDFMVSDSNEEKKEESETSKTDKKAIASSEEAIKIPSFLDVSLNFTADKVLYDNLTLANAKGGLRIKDEKASLENITADIFGGSIGINGSVETKTETPKFDMALSLNKIGITQSLNEMELLKSLAPIAQAFVGDLTTEINLNGDLTKDLAPIYSSLTGSGIAEILNATVQEDRLPFVSNLNDRLNFVNFDKLDLKDLSTKFSFEDGGVNFQPFTFNIRKDIKAEIKGRHTFNNELDYRMDLDVPAKYLGRDVSSQLAKLTKTDLENMKIDLPISVTGQIKNPKINVDIKAATQVLVDEIVEKQKQDLKDKAKDKGREFLEGIFGGGETEEETQEPDSLSEGEKDKPAENEKTKEEERKEKARNALENIFGKKKEENKDKE
ncbi:MAG TPA: AsmA-like C-terminal region-containing protein [Flavobacteriaceae bacterium]|nr:AsmA-like C-terminal region-containing protein [Flavobacteriaceae bacterium]